MRLAMWREGQERRRASLADGGGRGGGGAHLEQADRGGAAVGAGGRAMAAPAPHPLGGTARGAAGPAGAESHPPPAAFRLPLAPWFGVPLLLVVLPLVVRNLLDFGRALLFDRELRRLDFALLAL